MRTGGQIPRTPVNTRHSRVHLSPQCQRGSRQVHTHTCAHTYMSIHVCTLPVFLCSYIRALSFQLPHNWENEKEGVYFGSQFEEWFILIQEPGIRRAASKSRKGGRRKAGAQLAFHCFLFLLALGWQPMQCFCPLQGWYLRETSWNHSHRRAQRCVSLLGGPKGQSG